MALEDRGGAPAAGGLSFATTAYVDAADVLRAPLASPTFTGTPTAPTATAGDSSTKVATTAFVAGAVSGSSGRYAAVTAGGTRTFQRIATMDGTGVSNGAHLSMLVTGVGDFGVPLKGQGILQVGQRGTGASGITAEVTWMQLGNVGDFYTISTGNYTLEVWWQSASFQFTPTFILLDSSGATITMDSATTTAPANLVAASQYTLAHTASPVFSGVPQSVTPGTSDNGTMIATTAYVQNQGYSTQTDAQNRANTAQTNAQNYASSNFLPLSGGTLTGTLNVNTINWGSAGFLTFSAALNRNEGGASSNPGTGSTSAFVTVNSAGAVGRLVGSPRFPQGYTDVITTRALSIGSTGQLGTAASTIKKKNLHGEIAMDDAMLEKWTGLRTVLFDYKQDEDHRIQTGMIAEDVEALGDGFDHLLYYNEQEGSEGFGELDGLAYEKMPVWNRMAIRRLLERVQELERRIPA